MAKVHCAKAAQFTHLFVRLQSAQNASALVSPALTTCTHPHIEPMRNDYHYSVCQAESNLVDLPFVLVAVGRSRKLQLYSTAGFSCRSGQIAAHLSLSISAHEHNEWIDSL
jgi:hypothetical protein